MEKFDLLICGAGPVGCVIAHQAATLLNWKVLVVDRRNHLAGNCYDETHESSGVLVHRYGPHYFRSNNDSLIDFLSRFTEWVPGNYIVKSKTRGELFPFPINLLTLEQFFKRPLSAQDAEMLLASLAEKIEQPANSEEFVLSRVGRELFEAFYKGYTEKQWGTQAKDLAPSVCGRIPIRFNQDCRYVDHKHQLTPKDGFTSMFRRMLDHPNICLKLNTEFTEVRYNIKPLKATVYSGAIDEYFSFCLGKLPWRSLSFEWKEFAQEYVQPCVQINYPTSEVPYTRTVEIKHVTHQKTPNTIVSYEYSQSKGSPYYPIPSAANEQLFKHYWVLAEEEQRKNSVYFVGRLATYRYLNLDQVIESALSTFESIRASATESHSGLEAIAATSTQPGLFARKIIPIQ